MAIPDEETMVALIAERTGNTPEKIRRVRALARGLAVDFPSEEAYLEANWFVYERPDLVALEERRNP